MGEKAAAGNPRLRHETGDDDVKTNNRRIRASQAISNAAEGMDSLVHAPTDKAATMQRAAEIKREVERRASGLIDRFAEHRKRPLSEHLDDWHQGLIDKGPIDQFNKSATQQ